MSNKRITDTIRPEEYSIIAYALNKDTDTDTSANVYIDNQKTKPIFYGVFSTPQHLPNQPK
jgi:hypothetical protein